MMTAYSTPPRNMPRKSDMVRQYVASGEYRKALRIAKEFRLGISKEDSEAMKRGYECLVHADFYKQLGQDTDRIAQKGVETLIRLFGV